MSKYQPINFKQWIDDHRHLLKPPVGNQQVYKDAKNHIVMVVGGPNARTDYHYNETEEFFYQVEGDINLRLWDDGKPVDVPIKEGEIFLLPARIPHSPQRPANTIGLVMEHVRLPEHKDGLMWFCDKCHEKVYEETFHMKDIVAELKAIMLRFYESEEKRSCKQCGYIMPVPK